MNPLVHELVCRELKMTDGAVIELKNNYASRAIIRPGCAGKMQNCVCRCLITLETSGDSQKR